MKPVAGACELSVIIVSYNTREVLRECLRRVFAAGGEAALEVIVVDNASTDGSVEMVCREFPEAMVIESGRNLGFAGGNNLGIAGASGRYILLLNSDAYLFPGVLRRTIAFMEDTPDCGILGVTLVGEDGMRQPCARMLPTPWRKFLVISGIADTFPTSKLLGGPDYAWWSHDAPRRVGWVPGAYFLIRRGVVAAVGLMDARYFLYFEETDYCLQARRAGWHTYFFPHVQVVHLGGESSKATRLAISEKGKQLLRYQYQSEYLYYRKNFGWPWVLAAAGVELLWQAVVLVKNTVCVGPLSRNKRTAAKSLIRLMATTLRRGRFGKGPPAAA